MIIDLPPTTAHIIERIANVQGISVEQFCINSVYEKALEFAYMPNSETKQAIDELMAGQGKKFDTLDELMADLNA
ncbi:hypothetical protein [Moraxella bovis]|uniref:Uncharacterized protein n=1 Tax=Moraxella bovis TaxID=476 RepID=A0A1T0A6W8_MORBO|nr:hypothetical protein [Moraxella bovis]AWY20054.1 hypothetical protein DQF64_05780 [Moraxella bovis]OOR91400.1 hypothetical protein B0182_02835 [Moraxella bovis]UYZ67648.1 hypothetical protein LP122_07575 [Moraxella bovis]UYZ70021.1 hypothetical protein LP089_07660 [Moraxella bovis]UYZ74065.1 hypothetical protein LP105_05045 [Moraxella bovis]